MADADSVRAHAQTVIQLASGLLRRGGEWSDDSYNEGWNDALYLLMDILEGKPPRPALGNDGEGQADG